MLEEQVSGPVRGSPEQNTLLGDMAVSGLARELIERLAAVFYVCDLDGRIIYYNKAAVELWGREPEVGKESWCGSFRIFRPDGTPVPHDECPMAAAVREGRAVTVGEMVIERPDGSRRYILPHPEPIYDTHGTLVGTSNLLVDVTEHRRAELDAAKLAAIVESSDDAIVVKTLEGVITSWNRGAENLFRYTAAEAVGRPVTFLIPPNRQDEETHILDRIRHGERVEHFETRRLSKDGRLIDVSLSISPVLDRCGNILGASKIARDITRRKQAEAALASWNETLEAQVAQRTAELEQRARQLHWLTQELTQTEQRERRRLALVLHDEIQQLLVAIKMRASMAAGAAMEPILELADKAIAACRALTIGLSPPVLREGDLADTMNWLARHMGEHHGLEVDVLWDGPAINVAENSRVLLFAIVRELLFNVMKHAGTNQATIRLRGNADDIFAEVIDRGRGCEPDRLLQARKDSFGLFSIRERLANIGGELNIDSAPGKGCRVEVRIPRSPRETDAGQQAADDAQPATRAASNNVLRVLLADDHQIMRQGLAELLMSRKDVKVVGQASDGIEAVELARQLQPDVVVMDVSMPRLNGIEATRRIRHEHPNMRVVGLSMHEESEIDAAMRSAGADAYVKKDGPIQQLLSVLTAKR